MESAGVLWSEGCTAEGSEVASLMMGLVRWVS